MNPILLLLAACSPQDVTLTDASYHTWLAASTSGTIAQHEYADKADSSEWFTDDADIQYIDCFSNPDGCTDFDPSYQYWLAEDDYYVVQNEVTSWRSEAIMTSEGDFQITVHHELDSSVGDAGEDFRFAFVIDPNFQPTVCIQDGQTCYTGQDDDGDGLADYDDPDCLVGGWEIGFDSNECNDGIDNDGDGAVDLDDGDCDHAFDETELSPSASCTDGSDDDGDGWTDSDDPDCLVDGGEEDATYWGKATPAACNDGLDNDGDGAIDADDAECADAVDNAEDGRSGRNVCSDGLDNDGDGWTDTDDGDCAVWGDEVGATYWACNDFTDNDGDGDADVDDAGCATSLDPNEEDYAVSTAVDTGSTDTGGGDAFACADGVDNDGDGWVDADDADCFYGTDEDGSLDANFACSDGLDNDAVDTSGGDGSIDSEDNGCQYGWDNSEDTVPTGGGTCSDKLDDDGDGWTDWDDPDCTMYGTEVGTTGFVCNDGIDNDGDGDVDADDADCIGAMRSAEDLGDVDCSDGSDNDGDGWTDGEDPDCILGASEDSSFDTDCANAKNADFDECIWGLDDVAASTSSCSNGEDDDGDGWIDSSDADCGNAAVLYERGFSTGDCADGLDNDGDGATDADDDGCFSATDEWEEDFDECGDGEDNDGDGWTDGDDPNCAADTIYEGTGSDAANAFYQCNDGTDNDGDGAADADDADCESAWDNVEEELVGGDPVATELDYGVVIDQWSSDEEGHRIWYLNAGSYQLNPENQDDYWVLPEEWLAGYAHAKFSAEEFDVVPTQYGYDSNGDGAWDELFYVDVDADAPNPDAYAAKVNEITEDAAVWAADLETYGKMNKPFEMKIEDNQWRPIDLSQAGFDRWIELNTSWVRISEDSNIEVGGTVKGDYQIFLAGRESDSQVVVRGSFEVPEVGWDRWGYSILEDVKQAENNTITCDLPSEGGDE